MEYQNKMMRTDLDIISLGDDMPAKPAESKPAESKPVEVKTEDDMQERVNAILRRKH
jgi:hypothetical protein